MDLQNKNLTSWKSQLSLPTLPAIPDPKICDREIFPLKHGVNRNSPVPTLIPYPVHLGEMPAYYIYRFLWVERMIFDRGKRPNLLAGLESVPCRKTKIDEDEVRQQSSPSDLLLTPRAFADDL
jgi:hypothetical protein